MSAIAKTQCAVCHDAQSKYRCPRCNVSTCSLCCVTKHKAESNCDGVRDKTAFVDIKQFTDLHLLSDYRFLEEAGRKADCATRDPITKSNYHMPKYLMKLVHRARERKVNLKVLPYPLSKRKQNKSYFHDSQQQIEWQIEWVFPQAGCKFTNKVMESVSLYDALLSFLHPTHSDAIVRHQLKSYVNQDCDALRLFMKVEGRRANSPRYYELDLMTSIQDNLRDKLVIEYPTIIVALPDQCDQFTLLQLSDLTEPVGISPKTPSCT